MKLFCIVLCTVALSGCETLNITNRLAPTEACDQLKLISEWGPFGISTKIDPRDAKARLEKCLHSRD